MEERSTTQEPLIQIPSRGLGSSWAVGLSAFRRRRARIAAMVAVAAGAIAIGGHILGGVAGLWEFYRIAGGSHATRSHETATPKVAYRPKSGARPFRSLAVLLVTFDSSLEQDRELSRRITQELTAAAGRTIPDGLVVSTGLVEQLAQGSRDLRKLGEELNVRYLVAGRLAAVGATHQLTIELIDTNDGSQVWTDRQTISAGEIGEAVAKARNGLRNALTNATSREIQSLPQAQQAAWDLVFRAQNLKETTGDYRQQQELYEEALRLEPTFVEALSRLSRLLFVRTLNEPNKRDELVTRLDDLSLRATRSAPNDPRVWNSRARALRMQGNWSGAFAASDEALRIDPFRGNSLTDRAGLLIYSGRPDQALPLVRRALELNPGEQQEAMVWTCLANLQLGRDEEAVAPCEAGASLWPNWTIFMFLTAAYTNLGNAGKAGYWKRKLLEASPQISIKRINDIRVSDNAEFIVQQEHWFTGLRRAGIPEK